MEVFWLGPSIEGGLSSATFKYVIAGWYLLVMAPWWQLSQAAAFLRTYHYLVSEYLASSCFKSQGGRGWGVWEAKGEHGMRCHI